MSLEDVEVREARQRSRFVLWKICIERELHGKTSETSACSLASEMLLALFAE